MNGVLDLGRRAVLIGTSTYQNFPAVPAAANSLERFRELLVSSVCGWSDDAVTVILNQSKPGDIADFLATVYRNVTDIALFYFVGHGQVDVHDNLCLCLTNSTSDAIRRRTTSIRFDDVRYAFQQCRAQTKIVILDCCYAGIATRGVLSGESPLDLTRGTGAYTLAAAGEYERAWFETEPGTAKPQTYFTKYLLDAIEGGIPGAAKAISIEDIFRHAHDNLRRASLPIPNKSTRGDGRPGAFARNVAFTAKGEHVVAIYGGAQTGKTELILRLMGIRAADEENVRLTLRAGSGRGASVIEPTFYRWSEDDRWTWRADNEAVLKAGARRVQQHNYPSGTRSSDRMGLVRWLEERRRAAASDYYTSWVEIGLPAHMMSESATADARFVELHQNFGDRNEERKRARIDSLLAVAETVLVVARAGHLVTTPDALKSDLLKMLPEFISRYRLILTHAFSDMTTMERIIDSGYSKLSVDTLQYEFGRELEYLRSDARPNVDAKRIYPVELGASWSELRHSLGSKNPTLCEIAENLNAASFALLKSDIFASR